MNSLNKEEKDIILDFYFRCGSEERINQARDMIASDQRAAQLYARLERTLTQLDSVKYEPCPENLAEITIARLKLAASSQQARLESLLAAEQKKGELASSPTATARRSFWRNISEVAAVAAVILVVVGVYFPATSNMRQIALRNKCNAQMARVGAGIAGYANDNNGMLPSVKMTPGSAWWKVGDQGKRNQSNTRPYWLLVRKGYVKNTDFVCPGRKDAKAVELDLAQVAEYNDFPSRQSVNYSFKFMYDRGAKQKRAERSVLLSDLNPVFEKIFDSKGMWHKSDEFTRVVINEQLCNMLSTNHAGKGQNVLFGDGNSSFKKTRRIFDDDIFTVKGMKIYFGREVPYDEDDIFLAP